MMRLVGQVGRPIVFFFLFRMFCHRLIRWPPGPLGPLFKPSRSKRTSFVPLHCLSFPQVPFLPHHPAEARSCAHASVPVVAVCACRSRRPSLLPCLSTVALNGQPALRQTLTWWPDGGSQSQTGKKGPLATK
jgi:hypothetical protein